MSDRVLVVATADWQIADYAMKKLSDMRGDALFSLEQVVHYCETFNATCLLGAGDLYDSPSPSAASQLVVHRALDRLQHASIPFYYIRGNHDSDVRHDIPRMSVHPWATHVDRQRFCLGGSIYAAAMDYAPKSLLPAALDELAVLASPPGTELLMVHQSWIELLGNFDSVDGSLQSVRGAPVILTGDMHQHRQLAVDTPNGRITVLSPGAFAAQTVREPHSRFFYVLDYSGSRVPKITSMPLRGRYVLETTIDRGGTATFVDNVLVKFFDDAAKHAEAQQLPDDIRKPLLIVYHSTSETKAIDALAAACKDRCHLSLSSRSDRAAVSVERLVGNATGTATSLSALLSQPALAGPHYALAKALVDAPNVAVELEARKKLFFAEPSRN